MATAGKPSKVVLVVNAKEIPVSFDTKGNMLNVHFDETTINTGEQLLLTITL